MRRVKERKEEKWKEWKEGETEGRREGRGEDPYQLTVTRKSSFLIQTMRLFPSKVNYQAVRDHSGEGEG